jgi:hypothetical protein
MTDSEMTKRGYLDSEFQNRNDIHGAEVEIVAEKPFGRRWIFERLGFLAALLRTRKRVRESGGWLVEGSVS